MALTSFLVRHGSRIGAALLVCLFLTACGFQTVTPSARTEKPIQTVASPNIGLGLNNSGSKTPSPAAITATPIPATATLLPPTSTATPWPTPQGKLIIWEQLSTEQAALLRNKLEAFQKTYPDVQFTLQHVEGDKFNGQLSEAEADKSGPHLIIAPAERTGEWQKAKYILPLDNLLDKALLENFAPNILQGVKLNGSVWGVPLNFGSTLLLFYNKKLISLDKIPNSWEAMTAYVRANPLKRGEFYPLSADLYDPNFLIAALNAFGSDMPLDTNNQPRLNTEPMRQTLQFLQDAVFKNKVVPAEPIYPQMQLLFRTGRVAMIIANDENLLDYLNPKWAARLDLGVAPLPKVNDRALVPPTNGLAYFIGSAAGSDGPRLSALRAFLAFMAQPEQQRDLATQLKLMPPTQAGLNDPIIKNDPLLAAIAGQLQTARAVSPTLEWKALIEALRVPISSVVDARASAAEGAAAMQELALRNFKRLKP